MLMVSQVRMKQNMPSTAAHGYHCIIGHPWMRSARHDGFLVGFWVWQTTCARLVLCVVVFTCLEKCTFSPAYSDPYMLRFVRSTKNHHLNACRSDEISQCDGSHKAELVSFKKYCIMLNVPVISFCRTRCITMARCRNPTVTRKIFI